MRRARPIGLGILLEIDRVVGVVEGDAKAGEDGGAKLAADVSG
jgi:hypothetical protein